MRPKEVRTYRLPKLITFSYVGLFFSFMEVANLPKVLLRCTTDHTARVSKEIVPHYSQGWLRSASPAKAALLLVWSLVTPSVLCLHPLSLFEVSPEALYGDFFSTCLGPGTV